MFNNNYKILKITSLLLYKKRKELIKCTFSQLQDRIRNVGIVAHIDAGKTTTTECMLYQCGEIEQLGRVDTGDTMMDFLPMERERGITISSATTQMKWKNNIINIIDTPGHVDFTFEVARSARVLDGSVLIIDAGSGVQAQTMTVWRQTVEKKINNNNYGLPCIAFINKMDRIGADFNKSLESMKMKLNANIINIQYPLGEEEKFNGVIDLITLNKIEWSLQSTSRTPIAPTITPFNNNNNNNNNDKNNNAFYNIILTERNKMLNILALNDDIFLEKYLEAEENDNIYFKDITISDILNALIRVCRNSKLVPVLCGASLRGKGVEPLLDAICTFLPPPNYNNNNNNNNNNNRYMLVNKNDSSIKRKIIPLPNEELCAYVFKIVYDNNRGSMSFVRVFSGTLTNKNMIYNSNKNIKERINQLCRIQADNLQILDEITAGDVGCIIGLKNTVTGDTLMNINENNNKLKNKKELPITDFILDGLIIPDPVYAISIEPEKSSDLIQLEKALHILTLEDPSLRVDINIESGMIMLHGLGELHLEIVIDKLKRTFNLEVTTGKAYIGYKESITGFENLIESFIYDKTIGMKRLYCNIKFNVIDLGIDKLSTISKWKISNECRNKLNNICNGSSSAEIINSITEAFDNSFKYGPQGYPITGIMIEIIDIEKHPECTAGAIRACIASYIDKLFANKNYYVKLEPIMNLEIEVSSQYIGEVLNDLSIKRRATVKEVISNNDYINNQNMRQIIIGEVPLETMLGYATIIRSMTQGEGSFSMEYKYHAPLINFE